MLPKLHPKVLAEYKSPSLVQHKHGNQKVTPSLLTQATAEQFQGHRSVSCAILLVASRMISQKRTTRSCALPHLPSKCFPLVLQWNPSPLPDLTRAYVSQLIPCRSCPGYFLFLTYTKLIPISGPLHMLLPPPKRSSPLPSSLPVLSHQSSFSSKVIFPERALLTARSKVTTTLGHHSALYYFNLLCFPQSIFHSCLLHCLAPFWKASAIRTGILPVLFTSLLPGIRQTYSKYTTKVCQMNRWMMHN